VVKSINKFQKHGASLKDHYSADFDVLNDSGKFLKCSRQQKILIKIEHIKGHQDRIKKNIDTQRHIKRWSRQSSNRISFNETHKNSNPNFATAALMINELLVTADYKKNYKCLFINGSQGIYDE
jgi:hypothetical protein